MSEHTDDRLERVYRLDRDDMEGEYVRLTGDFGFWGERIAVARQAHALAKLDLDIGMVRVRAKAAHILDEAGTKYSEAAIARTAPHIPEYKQLHLSVIYAQRQVDHLAGILEALRAKKDMLISLGATLRQEFKAYAGDH